MTTSSILTLCVLALVLLLGPQLLRKVRVPARKHVPLHGGVLRMRAPRRYGIALAICALVPAGVLLGMAIRLWRDGRAGPLEIAAVCVPALAAIAVAAHQLAAAFRQGFLVDEFGFARVGVLRRQRLRWGDVAAVKYNHVNQWFFVTAADGSHLWIPVDTHGIADFAAIALVRLPPAALRADDLAREALEELAASDPI